MREKTEMTIVSQNRMIAVNYNFITAMTIDGCYILAHTQISKPVSVAKYSTEDRARIEFDNFITEISTNNPSIYEFPEE